MDDATQEAHGATATEPANAGELNNNAQAQGASGEPAKAEIPAEILKKLEALEADNKKYRDERRDTRAKQQALLEEQGQFKALADERAAMIEELSAKVAELEGLRSHADAWTRHQKQLEARIDERAQALADDERADLFAISDLGARGRMLDRLLGNSKKQVADIPRTGAPSNSSGSVDFDGLTGHQAIEAAKADPDGFRAKVASLMRGGAGKTRLG